jgi:DNA repair protein SbcD/Mre11
LAARVESPGRNPILTAGLEPEAFRASPDDRPRVTLMQISDCHLGFHGSGAAEQAFVTAIAIASDPAVQAVVVTGDLFDHGRIGEEELAWTAAELARLEKPVVLLPGNHDLGVWTRFDAERRCPTADVVSDPGGDRIDVAGTQLTVWGRAMQEHEPSFRPLLGVPRPDPSRWCLVAAHGLVVDDRNSMRSSPITTDDLKAVDWDCVLLGHVHDHRNIPDSPVPTWYGGSTGPTWDRPGGVVLVELAPGRAPSPQWIPLG